jgi:hypothetical protein
MHTISSADLVVSLWYARRSHTIFCGKERASLHLSLSPLFFYCAIFFYHSSHQFFCLHLLLSKNEVRETLSWWTQSYRAEGQLTREQNPPSQHLEACKTFLSSTASSRVFLSIDQSKMSIAVPFPLRLELIKLFSLFWSKTHKNPPSSNLNFH